MDAGPLIKLALADRLDLLLCFDRHVYIPDEVEFEAVDKFAWEHGVAHTPDKLRLRAWIARQVGVGRVSCPQTLIGEIAKKKRESGEYAPLKRNHRRDTGELAAHDFFNNRDQAGHQSEPALLLMDDRPGIDKVRLHNLDVHLLSTYALLIALEQERILVSAAEVWSSIERNLPTVDPVAIDESIRGDTDYRSSLKPRK
jgi:hypothetical protein